MLCTDWYPRHWNHSEIMTHSCWNISFIVSQFSFRENWYVCNFLLYRYEKEARRQSWEEQMLPAGQRWHLVVLVLVPATPTPWEKSSSRQTTRFSLQSRLERWTPLLQQQAPKHKPKCQYGQNRKGSVLTPSKTFFFKEGRAQQLILDSLIFLTSISRALIMGQALFSVVCTWLHFLPIPKTQQVMPTSFTEGNRLWEVTEHTYITDLHTWDLNPSLRNTTWTSPNGQNWNQIDYILCSWRWGSCIQSAKTRPGADCGSDHQLLIANFKLKLKKVGKNH